MPYCPSCNKHVGPPADECECPPLFQPWTAKELAQMDPPWWRIGLGLLWGGANLVALVFGWLLILEAIWTMLI